jgi:DNA-binding MarR family transcriptional regulator
MATETITLSANQAKVLKEVVAGGKIDLTSVDKRAVKALETRGLVKTTENKKGIFVAPTAKGKKALN